MISNRDSHGFVYDHFKCEGGVNSFKFGHVRDLLDEMSLRKMLPAIARKWLKCRLISSQTEIHFLHRLKPFQNQESNPQRKQGRWDFQREMPLAAHVAGDSGSRILPFPW